MEKSPTFYYSRPIPRVENIIFNSIILNRKLKQEIKRSAQVTQLVDYQLTGGDGRVASLNLSSFFVTYGYLQKLVSIWVAINGNTAIRRRKGKDHCAMSRSSCRWNSIYGLVPRALRGDEQKDICQRTRHGNQVNGGRVDSLREASSILEVQRS